ncbi:glycosyltransferase (plasmid) [Roseibium aggregatum]|uniref:glycosyltransferase n=1 Tax=Roseibium aggregatum TaxID=187304 RepID=UPI001E34A3B0|nr:glycosyltransferase [Roseibium aggregatum]UES60268.1 glycosyltransferase [Roseibium aggregatum]
MGTILLISNWFDVLGGTEVLSKAVRVALAERGHNVIHLACDRRLQKPCVKELSSKITKIMVPLPRLENSSNYWTRAAIYNFVESFLQRRKIKVDAAHFFHFSNIGLEITSKLKLKNVVITFTDYSLICPDFQYFVRHEKRICHQRTTKQCPKCTGRSSFILERERSENLHRVCSNNWKISYQTPYQRRIFESFGVPYNSCISELGKYPPSDGRALLIKNHQAQRRKKIRFAFFGRATVEKGLDTIVSASSLLQGDPKIELHAYLLDPENSKFNTTRPAINGNLFFHKAVSYTEVVSVMSQYDYLLLPSIWLENYPIVSSQAQEAGLGIVASNLPSLRDLPDFKFAHWVQPGNPQSWAQTIRTLRTAQRSGKRPNQMLRRAKQRQEFIEYVENFEKFYFNS